jgi:iron complex transport system ATP-binding protein
MLRSHRSLDASGVDVSVPGRLLVRGLELEVRPGEFVAILGQNGAGKTLTLQTLAGLRTPAAGDIALDGRPLAEWHRRELARRIGLLPQDSEDIFPASVFETALIGRHPHIGTLRLESRVDHDIASQSLARVGLSALRDRAVTTLSGGERRRLAIAQLLTQAPSYYLLDEPLNHLDPQHQLAVLRMFRSLATAGAAVIATLHDVNLARRYSDRCLMLFGDGRWEFGSTSAIVSAASLSRLFDLPMESLAWRDTEVFVPADDED